MHRDIESDSEDELPPGWIEKSTKDGNVYFVNTTLKETQWTHPRTGKKKIIPPELPFGWVEVVESSGAITYVNNETGQRTSTDPRLAFAHDVKESVNDFRQRFDASSTAFQVLHGRDLSGKTAVITGANSGIGYETAKSLLRHGCKVIFGCRNTEAANDAIQNIFKEIKASRNNAVALQIDLASLKSVKAFVDALQKNVKRVEIVILNAGVFGLPYSVTEDGYETMFQVNHLSHMYLAVLLSPLLVKGSRVVFVSSESHRFANFANGFAENSLCANKDFFSSMTAYNNSKLFNIHTADVLGTIWRSRQIGVNSLHPGNMVFTNLCNSWWVYRVLFAIVRPFTKSLQQAAATSVYCATAAELEGVSGRYFNNCFMCEKSAFANDEQMALNVFALSIKMIEAKVPKGSLEACSYFNFIEQREKERKENQSN